MVHLLFLKNLWNRTKIKDSGILREITYFGENFERATAGDWPISCWAALQILAKKSYFSQNSKIFNFGPISKIFEK